jgi:uncharacterized RDD family membrane protein YckC
MNWYYAQGTEQIGPINESDFQVLVSSGEISPDTLVWHEGMTEWLPCQQVLAAAAKAFSDEPNSGLGLTPCRECGLSFGRDEMISFQDAWICASCKPIYFQRLKEGAALPGTLRYAGFWVRFCAKFVDGLILGIISAVLSAVVIGAMSPLLRQTLTTAEAGSSGTSGAFPFVMLQLIMSIIQYGGVIFYYTWFVGRFRATPGKMALGLQVVMADGSHVSYRRAFARGLAEFLSSIILCIGYIMAGFDEEKRALHDRLCDTRVIYK